MNKKNVLEFEFNAMEKYFVEEVGVEKFRAKQVADWIYQKHIFDFEKMSNISKQQRDKLEEKMYMGIPIVKDIQISKLDRTTKFLFQLEDGSTIESVILYHANRVTACISTQVGCALKCAFCNTGAQGFTRNLTTGEIVSQVIAMEADRDININNIVFMGMGEPMLNYNNVIQSIKILNDKSLKNLGARHITISTSGIADKIEELADLELDIRLSLSLHAPSNDKRDRIMPINSKYPIEQVIQACKYYQRKTKNRVTIEYTAIKGFNDMPQDAERLAETLEGLKVMVNIIPVNDNPAGFEKPGRKFLEQFAQVLKNKGIEATIRTEKGSDIDAACGQLRRKKNV